MLPATVCLVIFLGEWDKRHLISSHLPLEMAISQSERGSLDDKELLVSAASLPRRPSLSSFSWYADCELAGCLCGFSDRRLVFLSSPFENVIKKVRYTVPLYALLSEYHSLAEKCVCCSTGILKHIWGIYWLNLVVLPVSRWLKSRTLLLRCTDSIVLLLQLL